MSDIQTNYCEEYLVRICPGALSTAVSLASFEREFYDRLRFFIIKHSVNDALAVLETQTNFLEALSKSMTSQISSLIQRNVAGVRLKGMEDLVDISTSNLQPHEADKAKLRTDAEILTLSLAKQYLFAVRDYARISPRIARSQFLICEEMAENLSFYSYSQIENLCERASSKLRFELTAPSSMYIKTIEISNAFSLATKHAVAVSKVLRELYSTTFCLKEGLA